MRRVTVRELRNHGGEILSRVCAGESLLVTKAGDPVAELSPVRRPAIPAAELLERWSKLPRLDPELLRADIDEIIEPGL